MRRPGHLSIYLCGPTVYGPPHLGHGRATLVYDILRRYLTWTGVQVRLVSNITDIDDKIIDRANREDRPWQEITHKCEDVWFRAMSALGVERPTDVPHATEFVESMVDMIATLAGCWRINDSRTCSPVAVSARCWVPVRSAIPRTLPSGSSASRVNPRGRRPGVTGGRGGTANVS